MNEEKPSSPDAPPIPTDAENKEKEPSDFIVVAEDSRPNRNILTQNFKKLGYGVVEFDNGRKAWEFLKQGPDKKVVAIFSDIMMPEMDGLELLKNIRSNEGLKATPFILISAVTQKEFIIEAKRYKANGYLLKPITSTAIKDKLNELFPADKN